MAETNTPNPRDAIRRERIITVLTELSAEGKSQRFVAERLGIPAQYLSDYRAGRRRITEQVAQDFESKFGYNSYWLAGYSSVKNLTDLANWPADQPPIRPPAGSSTQLPLLNLPIEGEPLRHPKFDGTYTQVAGAAEAKLSIAKHPYILRFGGHDPEKRIHPGDLLLMSQSAPMECSLVENMIQVIRHPHGLDLARLRGDQWIRLTCESTKIPLAGSTVQGHAIGITWSALG